ncbi:MAG TPA: hypothetical protein VLA61_01660 [Ideonella sp.]|nr:hypothetical protein [Ideonella sp.]HSI46956.1 hypothetical protein [Ideonella sp.]
MKSRFLKLSAAIALATLSTVALAANACCGDLACCLQHLACCL